MFSVDSSRDHYMKKRRKKIPMVRSKKKKKLKTKVRRKIRAKKKILTMNQYQIRLSVYHPLK